MLPISSWFGPPPVRELFLPGKVISLSQPEQAQWKIDGFIKDYDHQMNGEDVKKDVPSYATIKLSCHKAVDRTLRSMMLCSKSRERSI